VKEVTDDVHHNLATKILLFCKKRMRHFGNLVYSDTMTTRHCWNDALLQYSYEARLLYFSYQNIRNHFQKITKLRLITRNLIVKHQLHYGQADSTVYSGD